MTNTPQAAVDGGRSGEFRDNRCTHTMDSAKDKLGNETWWFVQLDRRARVHYVNIVNRLDCCGEYVYTVYRDI